MTIAKPACLFLTASLVLAGCSSTRQGKPSEEDFGVVAMRPSELPRTDPGKKKRTAIRPVPPDWVLLAVEINAEDELIVKDGWRELGDSAVEESITLARTAELARKKIWPRLMLAGEDEVLARAVSFLTKRGLASRLAVLDDNVTLLDRLRASAPRLRLFYGPIAQLADAPVLTLRERGFSCVVVPPERITEETVAAAHGVGLAIGVWQADDEDDLQRLLDLDADHLFTAFPQTVIQAQIKMGIRPSKLRKIRGTGAGSDVDMFRGREERDF